MPFTLFGAAALPPTWVPSDSGLLGAVLDPGAAESSFNPVAGTLYLTKIPVRSAFTVANVWLGVNTAGVGASTGSFAGLYSPAGLLLSSSADIGASLLAQGVVTAPLAAAQAVGSFAFVWTAFLVNLATTQPNMVRCAFSSGAFSNLNLAAAVSRFATAGTGLTSLPASITPASNTQTPASVWAGVN